MSTPFQPGLPSHPWLVHGNRYRSVEFFDQPWIASPTYKPPDFPLHPLDVAYSGDDLFPSRTKKLEYVAPTFPNAQAIYKRKSSRRNILRRILLSIFSQEQEAVSSPVQPFQALEAEVPPDRVTLDEWKAWGYWARPIIRGVLVNNTDPPGPIPPHLVDPVPIISMLRSPGGHGHPEVWVPGLQHPSLPPKPTKWKDPVPGDPIPFPWESQLNPYLLHRIMGPPPLHWLLQHDWPLIGDEVALMPLYEPDFAQPATYPFATHMYIVGVADEPAANFPWPFMITNPKGILLTDVVTAIHKNLQEFVSTEELSSWPKWKQRHALGAYTERVKSQYMTEIGLGLRRLDYLGQRNYFRGLEPSPNKDGWLMFVGPAGHRIEY